MKKRNELESKFNSDLQDQELLLKFMGDNEFVIIGTPRGNMLSRILLSAGGISLVTVCLVGTDTSINPTVSIGGSLLGLIMAGTPFLSFYSKKYFKIYFSKKLRQVWIEKGLSRREKRIDFSNIDYIEYKKMELDDLVSGDTVRAISYQYGFSIIANRKSIELFSIVSKDASLDSFVSDFAFFLSQFTNKETRALL